MLFRSSSENPDEWEKHQTGFQPPEIVLKAIELKEGMILYIPCEWYYKMETKEDCKLLHAESDTYFTSLYNEYRN